MDRQNPLKDVVDDNNGTKKPTTKGGIQKTKFTPTIPTTRRAKQEPPSTLTTTATTTTSGTSKLVGNKKPSSLLDKLGNSNSQEQDVSGTFAHGFGTFKKGHFRDANAADAIGSVTGIKRAEHTSMASSTFDEEREEALDMDSIVDQSKDPWAPVRINVKPNQATTLQCDTLNLLQLPGLLDLLVFGNESTLMKTKHLTNNTPKHQHKHDNEPEQVIDMDSFASNKSTSNLGNEKSWPANQVHRIGDIRFHKSGKISIILGNHCYCLSFIDEAATTSTSTGPSSNTSVWAIDKEFKHVFEVGKIDASLIGRFQFLK